MTDKETEILTKIVPQLNRLADSLWDSEINRSGRILDKIIKELEEILKQENQDT